jgi:tetratricopeptide (TPR) repeat protein
VVAWRAPSVCIKYFVFAQYNLLILIFAFLTIIIALYLATVSNSFALTRLQNQNDLVNYIKVLIGQGIALFNSGKYKEAISYYDKALFFDPNNVYALNNKGLALASLGNYTQSIKYYDKVLAINPKYISNIAKKK